MNTALFQSAGRPLSMACGRARVLQSGGLSSKSIATFFTAGFIAVGSGQCLPTLVAAGLFRTGVDDNGNCLRDEVPDPHYQIVEAPVGPLPIRPVTVYSYSWQFIDSVWLLNDATGSPGSKWIAVLPQAGSSTYGAIYVYRTTFTLPDGVSPNSVRISGAWSTDDNGRAMLLNGVPNGDFNLSTVPYTSFGSTTRFLITKGFRSGENTLDFVLTDDGGAITGLRVQSVELLQTNEPPPVGYNAAADFSNSQNPNSVWSYGWSATRGTAFHLDTLTGEDTTYGDLIGWLAPGFESSPLHIAYAAESVYHPSYTVPLGTLNIQPGPAGQNSVVRWTAPTSGAYRIDGFFSGNDFVYPTSTDVAILHGSTTIFSGEVNWFRGYPTIFALVEGVNAGETVDFTVGYGTDATYWGDSTAAQIMIRPLIPGDFNGDGCVDRSDLALLMREVRTHSTNLVHDLNSDGKVDIADARFLALHFGNPGGAPCD